MITYKHTLDTWKINISEYNQEGDYIWGLTEGDFYKSLPQNIKIKAEIDVKPIDDPSDANFDSVALMQWEEKVNKLFASKAQQVIDGILRDKGTKINAHVNFEWFLDFTKKELRKAVYATIQDAIINHWNEVKKSSSFNTNALSINNDLTNWIISGQQRNTQGWNALQNSKIDKYKVIGDGFVGEFVSEDTTTGMVKLFEWNNIELGDNKGEFNTLADAIAAITTIDKYDYVIINDTTLGNQVYRFEGVDHTDTANWDNRTIKTIEGNRYFVYKNIILAGNEGPIGKDGLPGKDGIDGKDGLEWINDAGYADVSEFANNGKDWEVVKSNTDKTGVSAKGTLLMKTPSDGLLQFATIGDVKEYYILNKNLIDANTSRIDNLQISSDEIRVIATANQDELQDNAFEKLTTIHKRIFAAGGGNPADPSLQGGLVSWGDLEDQTIRTDFMNNAKVGSWYTALIGAKAVLMIVRSGDKSTNFKLSGLSVNSGPTGDTFEAIEANVMSIAVSYWSGSFTGDFHAPYLQLPNSYNQMQHMPKAAVEQMIMDAAGSNEYANAQILSENQFYSHKTDTERTWTHGEKIATPSNQAGWPIKDNWTMDFYDDLKNVIGITYTPGLVQEAQFVFPEGVVNCKVEIKKIATWDNSWDGTGSPAGTNNGWEIKFHTPVDEQGNATTFHRDTTPLRMKLVSVNNNERIVDIPSDIFENFDNMVNKPVVNEEQWMQYNVVDSLGNRFLNYGPTAPTKKQVIVLPANRTIYDIEDVECYSNNRQRWYDNYTGTPLIEKFSKMTNRLYLALKTDNIESMMKVNIKLGRTDDKGNYTEFNAWEFRPVIENGVINPNKVEITNKGVFYGTYNGNLNPLPAGQADIHYMVIKYKGVQ